MAYVNNPQAAAFIPQGAAAAAAHAAAANAPPHTQAVTAAGAAAGAPQAGGNPGTATAASSLALLNMSNLINQKDSRWLQLEVCREFQRNKCSRSDTECKFAHPTSNVEVQNGRVTACYDSIKGRCNREKPPCKYFHPPQHLKDQLLINGRNHLALKNALMQQMGYMTQPFLAGQYPTAMNSGYVAFPPAAHGFIPHSPALQSPYLTSPLAQINPAMMSFLAASPTSAEQQSVAAAIQAANSNAVTSESTVQSTLRQVQMQTSMLPAMCPSQFTQHQAQQQQHAVMAAAAAQQQLQLAQPPGLTSKNKGDPRVEGLQERNL